ncbi:RagB/SusD family nutrient uptake outer membrane protein [Sunxiuqinia elliptica]
MKKIIFIFPVLLLFVACNDDFLERYPKTDITEEVFFSNVQDLETYTNSLYSPIGWSYDDKGTDNCFYTENTELFSMMRGELNEVTVGKWGGNWGAIRNINFFMDNYSKAEGGEADINHYVGIARLFRAVRYYGLVKRYHNVPWYSSALQTTDTELLYKTQDSRESVVDSIMADLEFAAKWIKEGSSKTRVNKQVALAVQARIALHEGTFRKYNSEFNLPDAEKYIRIAKDVSEELIASGNYSISYEKYQTYEPYESLFISEGLANNPEIILYRDYDKELGVYHNAHALFNYNHGLSNDLMLSYLYLDGDEAKPFNEVAGYESMPKYEVLENRDPRLKQTFMAPGFQAPNSTRPDVNKLTMGGFSQIKFYPRDRSHLGWAISYTDAPVIRYAEVLLMNAEAKAELNEISQGDVDATINLIRDRVNMPHLSIADANNQIDPFLENMYPKVSGSNKGVILEIRREWRVEFACEGKRYDNLMRWGEGQNFAKNVAGIYLDKLGYHDMNGDGEPDIAVVADQAGADAIPQEDLDQYKLVVYILDGNTFFLSEGDHGLVQNASQYNKHNWISPKYYLRPMNQEDILINENLKQTPFWAE